MSDVELISLISLTNNKLKTIYFFNFLFPFDIVCSYEILNVVNVMYSNATGNRPVIRTLIIVDCLRR